jgi:fructose-1,6-bisphosphatase I
VLVAAKANTPMFATFDAPPSMNRQKTKAPVFDEVCETTGVTLTRFMNEVAILNPELRELTTLFGAIGTACKAITNLVKRSQLPYRETLGYEGNVNVQGTDQKKLDFITNDLLKRALRFTGRIGVLASEEEDEPVDRIGPNNAASGDVIIEEGEKYVAVFDTLDESSNVDAGIPTGESVSVVDCSVECYFWRHARRRCVPSAWCVPVFS